MKKKVVLAAATLSVCVIGALINLSASSATPGSESDPLVSKSYVDEQYETLMGMILNVQNGTPSVSNAEAIDTETIVNTVLSELDGNSAYIPVSVSAGMTVIGAEGTEMILRSGQANAYSSADNGMVNATTGSELNSGENVALNNLIIIPRGDGRGITATTDCWFIIKGDYEISDL